MFLLGEYFYSSNLDNLNKNNISYKAYYENERDINITGLAFCLTALLSLLFIYIITDIRTEQWYVILIIKKGLYSCLIVLLWYYFIYSIYQINDYNIIKIIHETRKTWNRCYSIIFSILFTAGCLTFSFFFKDIIISFMCGLINLGMIIYYFSVLRSERNYESTKYAEGIIDIVMLVLSAVMITFLVIKYRTECLCLNSQE